MRIEVVLVQHSDKPGMLENNRAQKAHSPFERHSCFGLDFRDFLHGLSYSNFSLKGQMGSFTLYKIQEMKWKALTNNT